MSSLEGRHDVNVTKKWTVAPENDRVGRATRPTILVHLAGG